MKKIRYRLPHTGSPVFKYLLFMKITALLLLLPFLQASARGYGQEKFSLSLEQVEASKVFVRIQKMSEYRFFYLQEDIQKLGKINVHVTNATVDEIMDVVLGTSLAYKIIDNRLVVISPNKTLLTEQVKVKGKVVDESGSPLEGASVRVKGQATSGVTTAADGSFSIAAGNSDIIEISMVGYESREVAIDGKAELEAIVLKIAATSLDQVVVVGYGTQKKVNLTGAVSQISAEDLKDRPVTNMTQALQGEIPNLNIVIGSGKPGTSGTLNIRGNTSITSSGEPLVLIDGVPSEIDRVNVADVESITVLKDASASAIYGARAAFGVILVTTKRASKGTPVISYSNNFGWTTHATNTDFITTAYDNIRINEEAYFNALGRNYTGYTDEDYDEIYQRRNDKIEDPSRPWVMIKPDRNGRDVYKYYANFDWFNWFYAKWRPKQQHNISIMGSSGKINYYLSGSINNETGIMRQNPDAYKRYNFIAKVEAKLSSWFTVSTSTRYFKSDYTYYGKEGGMFPTVYNNLSTNQIYMTSPANVPTNPDGTGTYLTDNGTYAIGYGAHLAQMNKNLVGRDILNDLTTTIEGKVRISKDISITGNYTYNLENGMDMYRGVRLSYSLYPGIVEQVPRAEWDRDILKQTTSNNNYYIFNVFGNYNKNFGDHNIEVTAGYPHFL